MHSYISISIHILVVEVTLFRSVGKILVGNVVMGIGTISLQSASTIFGRSTRSLGGDEGGTFGP
jgi:membrane carboxypeptidase/penicillin-binding protein PbpC